MPELQDLEQLKTQLLSLGNEHTALNRRGIGVPDIAPPESEEDQELSDLLEGFAEDLEEDEAGEAAEGEESPIEEGEEPAEPASVEPSAEEAGSDEAGGNEEGLEDFGESAGGEEEESFDLDSLDQFLSLDEMEEREGEEAPEEFEEVPAGEDFSLEEAAEGPEEEEGFGAPEESEEFGDLEEPEEIEELEEFEEPVEELEAEDAGGEDGEESLEMEEFGEEETEAPLEDLGEEDEFALPDEFELDEDIFGEEEIPDLSAEPEEAEAAEEELGEEAGEEEPLPELEEEDEFSMPDLGEEGFEGEELELESFEEGPEETGEEAEEFEEVPEFETVEEGEEGGEEAGGLEELELPEEEFDEGEFELDEFNLGDLGEEFGVLEEEPEEERKEAAAEETPSEAEAAAAPIELSDEEFDALRETLSSLPRNLKLIVEEQIGEKGLSGLPLNNLVQALVQRKSPKEIAQITSKIIGRRIRIPSQYEKKTGAAFEAEKESFGYAFRHRILPLLRTIVLSVIAVGLLSFLGFRYVYQPLYALHLYNQGYEQLEDRDYTSANNYFQRGVEQQVMRKQFFRYAEAYAEQKQWSLAEEKYDQLLSFFPYDKEGILDYARMELETLSNYEKASSLLQNFLEQEPKDYDAMLLLGDTYLEWGGEDFAKYEQARYTYSVLMENYGVEDKLLFRMLKYFVRTDNYEEVFNIKQHYAQRPEIEVDPEAYTEMGGYLLDKGKIEDVREVLFRSREVDERLPETHYQLARYFLKTEQYNEESKALRNTLSLLQEASPMTKKRLEMKVDAYRRYGERLYAQQKYLEAQANYEQGIEVYEQALSRKLIQPRPELGKIYADLGDIYYYQGGDFEKAAELFEQAERNEFDSRPMKYKQGFISYRTQDYRTALMRFQRAAGSFSDNPNLIYATANTFYHRGAYQSAQGYYEHLLQILKNKLEQERPLLIDERRDHRALVENLMRVSNNLGVTYYNLHRKTGLSDPQSRAMIEFADSSRYFDRLTRNPETLVRAGLSDLGYLNQRNLLFPNREYELQIYADLPQDMEVLEMGS